MTCDWVMGGFEGEMCLDGLKFLMSFPVGSIELK